jgi:hypothetical protein
LLAFHHSTVLDLNPACAEVPSNERGASRRHGLDGMVMSPVL